MCTQEIVQTVDGGRVMKQQLRRATVVSIVKSFGEFMQQMANSVHLRVLFHGCNQSRW
jgi:hypothetical protein